MKNELWVSYIDCVTKKLLHTNVEPHDFINILTKSLVKRPNDVLTVHLKDGQQFRGKIKQVEWLAENKKVWIFLLKIGDEIPYLEMKDREKYNEIVKNYIKDH